MIRLAIIFNYNRNKRLRKDGTAAVLIRAYHDARHKFFKTGVYVSPSQWDEKAKRVIRHPKAYEFNQIISMTVGRMESFITELQRNEEPLSLERLQDYKAKKHTIKNFTDLYHLYLQKERHQASFLSKQQTLNKLRAFQGKVLFSQINYQFAANFHEFLVQQNQGTTSIHKHFKWMKKFIRIAVKTGHLPVENQTAFQDFRIKPPTSNPLYLTEEELEAFEQMRLPYDHPLRIHLDYFLFICYTGIRPVDLEELKPEHFTIHADGIELRFRTSKTEEPYHFNLRTLFPHPDGGDSRPERIIKRVLEEMPYRGGPKAQLKKYRTYVWPYAKAAINRNLKTIAQLLPIRKTLHREIHAYVGRHTFGTIMAGKIEVQHLRRLMTHRRIATTMKYVHLNKKAIEEALKKADW
ncbi:phage integrase SAM-like domain-containing protein [Phaeodactylibacter sp.]|jgi:integrase|uniref:phage integrase SAM-like domain-containing protein n=1 Tax=Phaeodactylibacter sp. TaxID=1940289 RepID=UPI00260067C0|nr:phage integrase SAM-like domain-containing protein [Phaeodactylibacter sp.]MCI4649776.1 site-specific integrase [Phaeodactylibacter sp.]MCI5092977.1 site-specific integrase [Phaeodactylibacter sp.]